MSAAVIVALTALLAAIENEKATALPPDSEAHFPINPFRLVYSRPLPAVGERFTSDANFAGGDAAYSIKIAPDKTLWLFGDSFGGDNKQKDRKNCFMVRNAVALDNPQSADSKPLFYLKRPAFFTPQASANFYWPGDGVVLDGKLYLFLHETENAPKRPAPYQFNPLTDHLAVVQNPLDQPERWRLKDIRLGNRSSQVQIGTACLQEGDYLYIYCANSAFGFGLNKNPTALARIKTSDLKAGRVDKMQWYSTGWRDKKEFLSTLWEDGASEMSVTPVRGLNGLFAFYLPFGGKAILMRHAERPEGPWSKPIAVYDLPQGRRDVFYYSAKAHGEYPLAPGEMLLTYCNNSERLTLVVSDKKLYFPKAVKIKIAPSGTIEPRQR